MNDDIILLVEDNHDDVVLALDAFRQCDLADRVEVVRDGAAALEYLSSLARPGAPLRRSPAVVVLDLRLPKIDGLEVLRQIRGAEATRGLPVVIFTSSHEERDVAASFELGANSYVRKPVDFEQFARAVSQIGRYWMRLNEPFRPKIIP